MLPIVALQWALAPRMLWRHRRILFLVPALLGTYLILTDIVAVHFGVWFFDEAKILGPRFFGVPLEEVAFFYLTSLLVVQSFLLFLPASHRH